MAKSKIKETNRKSVEGILDFDGEVIAIEVEEVGTVSFHELFKSFNGKYVSIVVATSSEGIDVEGGE